MATNRMDSRTRTRTRAVIGAAVTSVALCCFARAQEQSSSKANTQKIQANVSAKQIAQEAAQNELKALTYGPPFLRYRMHTINEKGDQIRDLIQSKDGPVARLIWKEHRALTPEEDEAERARLQEMLDSPSAYFKHVKGDTTGKKTAAEMIKALPDAMLYSFVEGQPQRAGHNQAEPPPIVIDFKPDPAFSPPSMACEALEGLQGRLWIDPKSHYVIAVEGNVFRGVNVGMALFAHVYPGGTLFFEQAEVTPGKWQFTRFVEHVTVRALMVKQYRENGDVQGSEYSEIGSMSYQDAIHTLLATPLPTHLP